MRACSGAQMMDDITAARAGQQLPRGGGAQSQGQGHGHAHVVARDAVALLAHSLSHAWQVGGGCVHGLVVEVVVMVVVVVVSLGRARGEFSSPWTQE